MSRTPTYTRLNVDELAGKSPLATVASIHQAGGLLMIEDHRSLPVPMQWFAVADKVRIASKTLKDLHAPIDPTERRATGNV